MGRESGVGTWESPIQFLGEIFWEPASWVAGRQIRNWDPLGLPELSGPLADLLEKTGLTAGHLILVPWGPTHSGIREEQQACGQEQL